MSIDSDRRDQPRAEPADDRRCEHGQRERQQDRLVLQPGIERPLVRATRTVATTATV